MSELVILVPVLNRPHNVAPLLRTIKATTSHARVLFLADEGDEAESAEIRRQRKASSLRVDVLTPGGNYASKINRGVEETKEPLLFIGADDLRFKEGWLKAAKAKLDPAQVVGVNDLIPRQREHTTHFLVTRPYAELGQWDGPGLLHEGYAHNFVDDELIATAKARGVYAYAEDAIVEHLHPNAGKVETDDVYRLGMANFRHDRRKFRKRAHQWT